MAKRTRRNRKAKRRELWRKVSELERRTNTAQQKAFSDPPSINAEVKARTAITWRLAQLLAAILTLFGAYAAWVGLQPKIEIEVRQPAGNDDRFIPYFTVRNSGMIAARDVTFHCMDVGRYNRLPDAYWPENYDQTRPTFEGMEYKDIGTLKAGGQVVRRCEIRPAPSGFERIEESQLAPYISYNSVLWPWTSVRAFMFELRRKSDGVWEWNFLQEGLSPAEARALHERGGHIWEPDPDNHSMRDYIP